MQIDRTYYGDYIVRDEIEFRLKDVMSVCYKIIKDYGDNVYDWPHEVRFNTRLAYWEVEYIRPNPVPLMGDL